MHICIFIESKYVREYASVGGNVKNSIWDRLYNVTAYACVLSDRFSLQQDICWDTFSLQEDMHK